MNWILGPLFRSLAGAAVKLYEGWLARQEIRKNERLKNELSAVRRVNKKLQTRANINVAVDPDNPSDGFDILRDGTGKPKVARRKRVRTRR